MTGVRLGLLTVAAACLLGVPGKAAEAPSRPKRVLMFVSDGFWAPEYYEPRAIYDRAGFSVTVAGKYADEVRPDRRNWKDYKFVKPDVTFDKVDVSSYDAVTFAGGNGAWEDFFPNDDVHRIVSDAFARGKLVALLCSSTGLLGVVNNYGGDGRPVAEGRHVTGYYRVAGLLTKLGRVNYDPGEKDKPYVVTDGRLITGRDPMSATLFGQTVARAVKELP